MQGHDLRPWAHPHDFATASEHDAERRTRWVVALTLAAMLVELTAGWLTGSMALLADGWHMGSHAAALGVAAFAYAFARRHRADPRFTFGTGKVGALAGYSSALLLGAGALWMLYESISRLLAPVPIRYADALVVAVLGLAVNLVSAWLLRGDHQHDHGHGHGHVHRSDDDHDYDNDNEGHGHGHDPHHHQDHNLRAAYLHVLADAATSVFAIVALGLGMTLGWAFMDPLLGLAGAALIGWWALGLARGSAAVLLDADGHDALAQRVRGLIEQDADNQVADLHLWRVGPAGYACIVSLVTHQPRPVEHYRGLLAPIGGLVHLTIEVNQCRQPGCAAALVAG